MRPNEPNPNPNFNPNSSPNPNPNVNPNAPHPTPHTPHPLPTTRIQRTTLTGETIEVDVTSSMPSAPNGPGMFGPNGLPSASQPRTPNTEYPIPSTQHLTPGSSYAAMNAAGVPYGKMTGQMLREQTGVPEVTAGEKWELFLAIAAPLLLLSAWLVHSLPHLLMWISFADLFVLSLVMGATGAVPSYDDSYVDVTIMLVVTFMFGPILALVAYLVVAAIKQECNGAIVGMLVLQLVIFHGLALAFGSSGDAAKQVGVVMMFGVMQFFAVFVGFLGWLLSSFFRPVGE